jgi:O-antigen/teichoic acid export membrane protein
MAKKFYQNLSTNALQLMVVQVFGLIIFYILSTNLDKNNFGQINMVLAILLAAFNILSFGIDQLVIKKIAAGESVQQVLSLYIGHVLMVGCIFYGLLFAAGFFFSRQIDIYNLLLLIGIGKLMYFFSSPFKQAASGLERFKLLAYMGLISGVVRCVGLLIFLLLHAISLQVIVAIFILGDAVELIGSILLFYKSTKTPLKGNWNNTDYFKLVREALPQSGVVIITSALARFDWIFIGLTLSAIKLAEYSFAYKIFEISTLPMLTIAPLLIPRFTKLFKIEKPDITNLKFLLRFEIIVAVLVALLLNMCWPFVIDRITGGKYGMVNINTIFILSFSMPLLYINNFLWTIYFAKGQLKMILKSFIITLAVNVIGDIILIPIFKNEGAAFAFSLSCLAQTIFYLVKNEIPELHTTGYSLVICTACALCSGISAKLLFSTTWMALPFALFFYIILLALTFQLKLNDRKNLQVLLNW